MFLTWPAIGSLHCRACSVSVLFFDLFPVRNTVKFSACRPAESGGGWICPKGPCCQHLFENTAVEGSIILVRVNWAKVSCYHGYTMSHRLQIPAESPCTEQGGGSGDG